MATAKITRNTVEITLVLTQEEADWLRYLTADGGTGSSNRSIWLALEPLTTYKPLLKD